MLEEEYKQQVDDMLKVELDNMRLLSGVKAKKKKGKKKKKKGKKKKYYELEKKNLSWEELEFLKDPENRRVKKEHILD